MQEATIENLHFSINYKTEYGYSVYVIGNLIELGQWNIE